MSAFDIRDLGQSAISSARLARSPNGPRSSPFPLTSLPLRKYAVTVMSIKVTNLNVTSIKMASSHCPNVNQGDPTGGCCSKASAPSVPGYFKNISTSLTVGLDKVSALDRPYIELAP